MNRVETAILVTIFTLLILAAFCVGFTIAAHGAVFVEDNFDGVPNPNLTYSATVELATDNAHSGTQALRGLQRR